ncbi:methyltransferase domain-containing protein [Streptomyces iconiensis]|uniref:Protein-L-isoaspartate O-methyltransferase n=1 Tax=Streptomyces iconiensis TaxID=1384038 RepID=A0ABT7A295_9ACTN|nr:methyltransferase domain-containing protein [Streptomyces iconiensis]MDJ1135442.1 methyltransferase domain-containing protein [Streptomyces iconiensis]
MTLSAPAGAGTARLLAECEQRLEYPVPGEWVRAFHAVPRHRFLPERLWLRDGAGGYASCDRGREPDRWWRAAYRDQTLVVQLATGPDGFQEPTSAASAPSTMLRMLELAQLDDDGPVLEVGTGTGFHAALLCHRLGAAQVTSIDIDSGLVHDAKERLRTAGYEPTLAATDGTGGHQPGAPYARILSTVAVHSTVPAAWTAQVRYGGRIVTPFATAWLPYGTLVLDRHRDRAEGRFHPGGSYMGLRGRTVASLADARGPRDVPAVTGTTLSPWRVAGEDLAAQFAIGLRVPGAWHSWDTGVEEAHTRLWVADEEATSWAAVDYDGSDASCFRVAQHGPRRLWEEIETAYRGWSESGRPGIDRHGITVDDDGRQRLWIDQPSTPLQQ